MAKKRYLQATSFLCKNNDKNYTFNENSKYKAAAGGKYKLDGGGSNFQKKKLKLWTVGQEGRKYVERLKKGPIKCST